MQTLHLLIGLPGSGKTTLSKLLQKQTDAIRISSDDFRKLLFPKPSFSQSEHDNLYALVDHNVEHLLQAGHSVVYDANLNRRVHRQEKYDMAKRLGVNVRLWWVKTDRDLSKQRRIDNQDEHLLPIDETSSEMFDRISDVFEAPTEDESYTAIQGVGLTSKKVSRLV